MDKTNQKIILAVVITFVITVFLTSYVLYMFQANRVAVGFSSSSARMAAPDEGGGGSGDGGFSGQGSGVSTGVSIGYFQWIWWSITTSWCIKGQGC